MTHDSRSVRPGDLYAALPGATVHGAQFARAARESGAVAVLTDPAGVALMADGAPARGTHPGLPVLVAQRPREVMGTLAALVYGEPAGRLQTFGITGTNGKTTTAYLLDAGLRALGVRTGLIGTVETRVGDRWLSSARTTPEATDLHAVLAAMVEAGCAAVVMEVSSHALVQHRVDGVLFDVVAFTNLSQDHLDYHGDMEHYFAAKASLFTPQRARHAVVCTDDAWGQRLAGQMSGVPVTTLRRGSGADWAVRAGGAGRLVLSGEQADLTLPCHLPGDFNEVNTAMAAVLLLASGRSAQQVEVALAAPPHVPGRMEPVTRSGGAEPGDPRVVVDYAHTPEAVAAALAAIRPTTAGRLVVVLGAGGDRDHAKRAAMGAAAARYADDLVVTDDNPRGEDPADIRAALLAGARAQIRDDRDQPAGDERAPGPRGRTVFSSAEGRAAHIARAVSLARSRGNPSDNTVVVLGKGHENGQEIAGVLHPFEDRAAVQAALEGRRYEPGVAR